MITLNGNLLCSIDVETTGLNPLVHDIWEVAMIPINSNLCVDKTRPIFDIMICPENLIDHSSALSGVEAEQIRKHGIPPSVAEDLFTEWFTRLGLGTGRRITPLAHNWKFDCQFISKWLGYDCFQEVFDGRHRDSLQLAIALNDAHELAGLEVPFPKQNLTALCARLDIPMAHGHRALEDAAATIDVYKKLIKRMVL